MKGLDKGRRSLRGDKKRHGRTGKGGSNGEREKGRK